MKKLWICAMLLLAVVVTAVACGEDDTPAETTADVVTNAPTEALAETPTEEPTEALTEAPAETFAEIPTEESAEIPPAESTAESTEIPPAESTAESTEIPTEESTADVTEAPTEEATTEAPAPAVEPTAYFSAEDIADLIPANATLVLEDGYVHFLTGTEDTVTNPSITLTAPEGGFTDIIAIKYRTNCGTYGSNYWGTFLLNGTAEFYGNRRDSDNWFFYYTDGEWDVLILDMRKHKQGSDGIPDTDVTGGAAIEFLVYNFFDYTGNDGKLATANWEDEYIDIAYIAFFENKDDAYAFTNS